MSTKAQKKQLADSHQVNERWETLLRSQKSDPQATTEMKPMERLEYGLYLQRRDAYQEIYGDLSKQN